MDEPETPRVPPRRAAGWGDLVRERLRDPVTLAIIAATFFVSALGQTAALALLDEQSVLTVAALSVLGSIFLAAAIVVAAVRWDRDDGKRPRRR